MGMAFTDALISHADVRVALLDWRHAPGWQWLDAYHFVRLHQASALNWGLNAPRRRTRAAARTTAGVARAGHRRADLHVLRLRPNRALGGFGPGELHARLRVDGRRTVRLDDLGGAARRARSRPGGQRALPLSASPPSRCLPSPLTREPRATPVNDLVRGVDAPSEYVVVGSGKTATDACIWLLDRGEPDRVWVHSREPWMLNRAMFQPDPLFFLGAAADVMEVAATAHEGDARACLAADEDLTTPLDAPLRAEVRQPHVCEVGPMDTLPMLPLGSALLPGSPLPLQIFEPRYLTMLRDIASGNGRFGVVLIERGVEVGGGDQRFSIGTVATIEQMSPTAGGPVRLLARGRERFEVTRWLPDDPHPRAEVRLLPALEWSSEHAVALAATEHTVRRALTVMSEYRTHLWPADVELADDPVTRSWQLAGIAPLGELDQLTLLRFPSVGELLESTARLTSEAVDLLPMQFPDGPG